MPTSRFDAIGSQPPVSTRFAKRGAVRCILLSAAESDFALISRSSCNPADCPSGQWERTVNPSAYAYVGSNPTSATHRTPVSDSSPGFCRSWTKLGAHACGDADRIVGDMARRVACTSSDANAGTGRRYGRPAGRTSACSPSSIAGLEHGHQRNCRVHRLVKAADQAIWFWTRTLCNLVKASARSDVRAKHAPLAQSAERFHGKEKVNGSIPLGGSLD